MGQLFDKLMYLTVLKKSMHWFPENVTSEGFRACFQSSIPSGHFITAIISTNVLICWASIGMKKTYIMSTNALVKQTAIIRFDWKQNF